MSELARAGLLLSLGVFVENRAFGSQRSADYLSVVRPRSQATAGGLFLLDYGTFYASKSFEIPNSGDSGWPLLGSARRGRRILWGWADETDTCGPWPACTKPGAHSRSLTTLLAAHSCVLTRMVRCAAATGPRPPLRPRSWRGLQTLPRDVSYDPLNDVVLTLPVPELSALRTGLHAAASAHVAWPNREAQCSSRQRGGKTVRRRTRPLPSPAQRVLPNTAVTSGP